MSNLEKLDSYNVRDIRPEYGFAHDEYGLLKPHLIVVEGKDVIIAAVTEAGRSVEVSIASVPHMQAFDADILSGAHATLHHRKGGQTEREQHLRLLEMRHGESPAGATEIYFGEHTDHPGEVGFFLYALHVGNVNLLGDSVTILSPDSTLQKYFPIGAAALGSTGYIL